MLKNDGVDQWDRGHVAHAGDEHQNHQRRKWNHDRRPGRPGFRLGANDAAGQQGAPADQMQQAKNLLGGKVPIRDWANEHGGNDRSQRDRHEKVPNVGTAHLPIEVAAEGHTPTAPNRKLQQVGQLQPWVNTAYFVFCHPELLVVFGLVVWIVLKQWVQSETQCYRSNPRRVQAKK
ncbi:MAG: hypothetical protein NTW03_07055 [Verrucomicrobia bacterium]|nr:hypothetical protein [Verrucomicrobiota bacterium]